MLITTMARIVMMPRMAAEALRHVTLTKCATAARQPHRVLVTVVVPRRVLQTFTMATRAPSGHAIRPRIVRAVARLTLVDVPRVVRQAVARAHQISLMVMEPLCGRVT